MGVSKRFMIPASLGILATLAHYSVLASKVKLSDYVVLKKPVAVGEEITLDAVAKVQLPGDEARLRKILVPWSEKHLVLLAVAQRNMFPDDVLFWQDAWRKENESDGLEEDEKLVPLDLSGVIVETMLLMPGQLVWFEIALDADDAVNGEADRNGRDDADEPQTCEIDPRYLSVDKPPGDGLPTPPRAEGDDRWSALDRLKDLKDQP